MILTKGEALRRGILILFLAIVLIGIVFGIGFGTYMCVMNSCCKHSTPFEYLESYDEVKSVFARNKNVLFPDLAALELDESTTDYEVTYASHFRRKPLGYVVIGNSTIAGETIRFILSCETPEYEKTWGTRLSRAQYDQDRVYNYHELQLDTKSYSEDVFFRVDGYLYGLEAQYHHAPADSGKPPIDNNALIALKDEVHEIMFDYMNAFFEEVKAK